ncbi:MAG: ABC transporter permease [Lachnospirales bacterium]
MNEKSIKRMAPFLAVILGLFFGFVLLIITGNDAIEGYKNLFLGGIKGIGEGNFRRFGDTFSQMTPILFTGISVAFAFRTGLFNIGASGQFLMGGFVAVFLGVVLELPPFLHPIVCLIGAAIAGGLWGSIPGFLKAKFNVHEVVTCIMLNYVSIWLVQWLVKSNIPGAYDTESANINTTATLRNEWLTTITDGSSISVAFFLGIIVLVIIYFILEKTTFGYELKAVGFNSDAAKYAGMKVNRNVVLSMAIAGVLAGIGGAAYYIGYTNHVKIGTLPDFGFDGIAVSLLGLNAPLGVFLSSFLFGYLKNGGSFMSSATSIPQEIVDIVIAVIIYFSAISIIIEGFLKKIIKSKKSADKSA